MPRPLVRTWRSLGRRARFKVKVAAAIVLLTSPVWTLNLVVAFLGHSVVFPLSPYFLRQKLSAVISYVRHRPTCLAQGHPNTDVLVKRVEARHNLPRGLLAAVIQVESRGLPHRISYAGAMGPGQLMPDTARELGVNDPFDTTENVKGAATLLSAHLARFHNVRLAVAAYNAGPGAVHGRIPNNGQTPAYVAKVMHAYAALRPAPSSPARHRSPGRRATPKQTVSARGPALASSALADDTQ
ncbi:MAG: lytic transglycosylase domain-containing protein [Deltaproteobacteria bacterium]|nr:lytic transglycosylase domain-containing protein [Deltaproteobacteria bacterium]